MSSRLSPEMVAPYLEAWYIAASECDIKDVGGRRGGITDQQGKVGCAVINLFLRWVMKQGFTLNQFGFFKLVICLYVLLKKNCFFKINLKCLFFRILSLPSMGPQGASLPLLALLLLSLLLLPAMASYFQGEDGQIEEVRRQKAGGRRQEKSERRKYEGEKKKEQAGGRRQ